MTVHLPAATNFCSAEIPLFEGLSFYVDGNSKITAGNGTYERPAPNAFSLPAASVAEAYPAHTPRACPGSTPACRSSCYVQGLAKHAPGIYGRYRSNAEALAYVLRTDRTFYHSALLLASWIEEHAAKGFRWHVSGDVWDLPQHAQWIVEVCTLAAKVDFWIYTRTLAAVPVLSRAQNLAVNVSADEDNFAEAKDVSAFHGATLCYLTSSGQHAWEGFHENAPRYCKRCGSYDVDHLRKPVCIPDLPAGSVIFPDYPLRTRSPADDPAWWNALTPDQKRMTCPTDQFGQSEAHRCGPCRKCLP